MITSIIRCLSCRSMPKQTLQIILLCFLSCCGVARAGVIALTNQSPIIAIFGLPAPVDFEEPNKSLSLNFNLANNFVPRSSANETLELDGETSRLLTHYRQRLSRCWMFSAELPVINHAGGVLDSFVDSWHQWFGLPESGRREVASDRLVYRYTVDGEVVLQHTEVGSGIGDVSLIFTQRQSCGLASGRLLRAGVKLPTGDPDKLFGSGATDVFFDISQRMSNIFQSFDLSYTAGILLTGKSRVIPRHKRQVFYGSLSFELPVTERLSLDAQLALQSPHIKSELRVLSDWPVQLLVGMSFQVSNSTVWNIVLSEDPEYGTSSDVVFQFGMRTSY